MSTHPRVVFACGLVICLGCAKAPPGVAPGPTPVGFVEVSGHTCYAPEDFSAMTRSEAQRARIAATEDAKSLWRGEVDAALVFSSATVTELDDRLLAHGEDLGALLVENLRLCTAWAAGDLALEAYERQLRDYARSFDKGRCQASFFSYVSQGLSLDAGWQLELPLCAGQSAVIETSNGRYCIDMPDEGDDREPVWIDAEGDLNREAEGEAWPCPAPTCQPGQVIGRFAPWEGEPLIFPIGKGLRFEAPFHGTLSVRVNDDAYGDNGFFEVERVPDFLVVEITPGGTE